MGQLPHAFILIRSKLLHFAQLIFRLLDLPGIESVTKDIVILLEYYH